jgi:hypothetical protein
MKAGSDLFPFDIARFARLPTKHPGADADAGVRRQPE